MTFALSVADITFPLLDADAVCDLARLLGFEAIDLFVIPEQSQLKPDAVLQDSGSLAREIRARLEGRGLVLSDFFVHPGDGFESPLSLNIPDDSARTRSREWFQRMVAFGAAIGAPGMTVMPGPHWKSESRTSSLNRAADELGWRVEQGAEVDVQVSAEPHTGSIVDSPELALELVERTPGLTLTVDYSHFVHDGFTDRDCERLLPHARHVHARGARKGRLQEAMKLNSIDFRRLTEQLAEIGYSGFICCENIWFEPLGCDDVDNLSETLLLRDQLIAGGAEMHRPISTSGVPAQRGTTVS
jgi:sugar phosphate isomerase/epimerase